MYILPFYYLSFIMGIRHTYKQLVCSYKGNIKCDCKNSLSVGSVFGAFNGGWGF